MLTIWVNILSMSRMRRSNVLRGSNNIFMRLIIAYGACFSNFLHILMSRILPISRFIRGSDWK